MAWKLPPDQNAMGGVFGAQDLPLWMQSGMQDAPPPAPYQTGDFQRSGPQMRRQGVGESVANALLPQRDEQGIPKPMGAADIINAALWVLPGARGTVRPQPFKQPSPPSNFNRSPEGMARDQIRAEINEGIARVRQQAQGRTAEIGGEPLVLNPHDIQEGIRRRMANSEAIAGGAQPGAQMAPQAPAGSIVAEYGQRLKQALGNREAWEPLMKELQADPRMTLPDLVQISSDFYGGIPKGSSRAKAIDNIQKRHTKLTSWKDELDSGVLK